MPLCLLILANTNMQHETKYAHKTCQGTTRTHMPINSFYRVWSLCKSFFIDNFLSWRIREKLTPDLSTIRWPCLRYQWVLNFMPPKSRRDISSRTRDITKNVLHNFWTFTKTPVTLQRFDAHSSYCACLLTRPSSTDTRCITFLLCML